MRTFLLSVLPFVALAIPAPVTPNRYVRDVPHYDDNMVLYNIEAGCQKQKYDKLLRSVENARDMAKLALKEWWDEGKHGEAAATYLAIPNDGNYKANEFAQRVQKNLFRVANLAPDHREFNGHWAWVDIWCHDKHNMCKDRADNSGKFIGGYAKNLPNSGYHLYHVVMCDPYYGSPTPAQVEQEYPDQAKRKDVTLDFLHNDAQRMLHEMMHIHLVSQDRPEIDDVLYNGYRAYTAPFIAEWVKNGAKTADVVRNADSYAVFATAVYFTSKWGFLPPPTRELPLDPELECNGVTDQYVDKGQDKHIADFCDKIAREYEPESYGTIEQQYNQGAAEHFSLSFSRKKVAPLAKH